MNVPKRECPVLLRVTCLVVLLSAAFCSQAYADLEQVEEHYVFNEYAEALQLLAQLAATDPDAAASNLEHQIWLARCLVQAGDNDAALAAFCRVRDLDLDWQPDPVLVPLEEREIFARAVAECARGPASLSIITVPAGARAWLDGHPLAGKTPMIGLEREPGAYDLSLRLDGHLEYSERIEIKRPETVIEVALLPSPSLPRPDPLPEKTRGGAVARSLIPGLGQFYKGQTTKGAVVLGIGTVMAGMAITGHLQRGSRLEAFDEARADYEAAVSRDELEQTFAVYQDRADAVRRSENLRDIGLYAFVGVYVFNLVDAALGFPLGEKAVSLSAEAPHPGEARFAVSIAGR